MDKCKNCGVEIESDGHGDKIHVREDGLAGTYGCKPGVRSRALDTSPYPVAE